MEDIVKQSVREALENFIKKEKIDQKKFAKEVLGWSPQALNDALKGRRSIGKKRRTHIISKLGPSFEEEINQKIDELRGKKKGKAPQGFYTEEDQKYVDKLIDILHGKDEQKKAIIKGILDLVKQDSWEEAERQVYLKKLVG